FGLTTLFSFVTLPVEFNATAHANEWLARSGIVSAQQMPAAKNALWWAAMTYVVAALGSLGQLFYYIRMYMRASSR
ncbi:MAG: zinc metallopeptidase, partial [Planctomycetota bacterium]